MEACLGSETSGVTATETSSRFSPSGAEDLAVASDPSQTPSNAEVVGKSGPNSAAQSVKKQSGIKYDGDSVSQSRTQCTAEAGAATTSAVCDDSVSDAKCLNNSSAGHRGDKPETGYCDGNPKAPDNGESSKAVCEKQRAGTSTFGLSSENSCLVADGLVEGEGTMDNLVGRRCVEREPVYRITEMLAEVGSKRRMVVVIDLPAMAQVRASGAKTNSLSFELDVASRTLDLRVPSVYKLSLGLPLRIDPDLATAKFSKKRAALTISAPEK